VITSFCCEAREAGAFVDGFIRHWQASSSLSQRMVSTSRADAFGLGLQFESYSFRYQLALRMMAGFHRAFLLRGGAAP
jgi:hypothetical protein